MFLWAFLIKLNILDSCIDAYMESKDKKEQFIYHAIILKVYYPSTGI